MTTETRKELLEALRKRVSDKFNKGLVQAYARDINYSDLEAAFIEQLTEEAGRQNED